MGLSNSTVFDLATLRIRAPELVCCTVLTVFAGNG
jgi:hypothetical protein